MSSSVTYPLVNVPTNRPPNSTSTPFASCLQYVAQLEKRQAIERVRQSIAARSVSERLMRKSLSLCAAASK